MKIIVFGANGKTGKKVIEQALNEGMYVTAFVREAEKLKIKSENLDIVVGEATKYDDVKKVIIGHDAVINCIGGSGTKPSTIITGITENIVNAMNEAGIKRIAQVGSAGVHGELTGIIGKCISYMLRNTLKDHKGAYECLKRGGIDFTFARPVSLTNDSFTGVYRETQSGVPYKGMKISRSDVADFLIKAIKNDNYIGKSVGLSY